MKIMHNIKNVESKKKMNVKQKMNVNYFHINLMGFAAAYETDSIVGVLGVSRIVTDTAPI